HRWSKHGLSPQAAETECLSGLITKARASAVCRMGPQARKPCDKAARQAPEQFTNEMSSLLCKDFQENPCHEMRAGRLLPAVNEHFGGSLL
ncbi:hypothetical protein V6C07_06930, partial [Desulfovibrio sp. 1214_IL3152]